METFSAFLRNGKHGGEKQMNNQECLNQKRALLSAMPEEMLKHPRVPLERFHQESEYLLKWCEADRSSLVAAGLDWTMVEDLPIRIGASRQARRDWLETLFLSRADASDWEAILPIASDFRERLIHSFFYAYRNQPVFLGQVKEIAKGDEETEMVNNFDYLITLARENPAPLHAVNFNFALVDDADFLLMKMSDIRNRAARETAPTVQAQYRMRAAAYTHLKEGIDTVRACGQYVFSRNANRLRGYEQEGFSALYDKLEDKNARYGVDFRDEDYASVSAASSASLVRAAS